MERFEQPDLGPHTVIPPVAGRIRFGVCGAITHQLFQRLVAEADYQRYIECTQREQAHRQLRCGLPRRRATESPAGAAPQQQQASVLARRAGRGSVGSWARGGESSGRSVNSSACAGRQRASA
jgi:hypothetical protein